MVHAICNHAYGTALARTLYEGLFGFLRRPTLVDAKLSDNEISCHGAQDQLCGNELLLCKGYGGLFLLLPSLVVGRDVRYDLLANQRETAQAGTLFRLHALFRRLDLFRAL